MCPSCGQKMRRCPWCGETIPWVHTARVTPCCGRSAKYVRIQGANVPLLSRGEALEDGPVYFRIAEAVYHTDFSTVYRVTPVKRLGDPFVLDGEAPPASLCLKEFVTDPGAPRDPLPPDVAERLAKLRHRNIVPFYKSWSENHRRFTLSGWADGETAAQRYLNARQSAPAPVLRRIAEETLDGLMALAAPEIGLLHGDITPFNLVFGEGDRPLLIDFGSLQRLDAAEPPHEFTPHYAPLEFYPPERLPETWRDRADLAPGAASDRYMLGATLTALAVGLDAAEIQQETDLPVVVAAPERALGTAQARLGALRPDLPRAFNLWVDDMLALAPQDRFASHEAAAKALKSGARGMNRATSGGGAATPQSAAPGGASRQLRYPRGKGWGAVRRFFSLPVLLALLALSLLLRYPSALRHPGQLPNLLLADIALRSGQPQAALDRLDGVSADPRSWDAQILLSEAQERLGARRNALQRLRRAAAEPGAPGRVKRAYRRAARDAGIASLSDGLRALNQGEQYRAYVLLTQATALGARSALGDKALIRLALERGKTQEARQALERYLAARPQSGWGHLLAARQALAADDWRAAHEYVARAMKEAARPPAEQTDPVPAAEVAATVRRVASALIASLPTDPRTIRSRAKAQEALERLEMARDLQPTLALEERIARYRGGLNRRLSTN